MRLLDLLMLMKCGNPVSGNHLLCFTLDGHVLDINQFSFQFLAASYAPMGRRMAQRDDRVGRRQGLDPVRIVSKIMLCERVSLILSVIVN